MRIDIYHHVEQVNVGEIKVLLTKVLSELSIIKGDVKMALLDLTELEAAVTQETTVEAGVVTLLQGISAKITDLQKQLADAIAAGNPAAIAEAQAKITAFAASIKTSSDNLAAAAASVPA